MSQVLTFLTRTRGGANGRRIGLSDVLVYSYLLFGVALVVIPVLWAFLSSLKSKEALDRFDTRILPYAQVQETIEGLGEKPVYFWNQPDGTQQEVFKTGPTRRLTQVAPLEAPTTELEAPRNELVPKEELKIATENYLNPLLQQGGQQNFFFFRYLSNTVFVTVTATLITLLINSMAAYALSKYRFKGRMVFTALIISTLLIPATIILVSLFFVVWTLGIFGSIWGVIIPAAATPTGVFLLRQYMLTIPDELIEAARMDAASEWKIFWRIILPLSLPALAVLAILSVIWRWNDFLWPLIVLISDPEQHTLQIGLTAFSGQFSTDYHYILAMTVVSLLPVTAVFAYMQRFITTGIASTGLK